MRTANPYDFYITPEEYAQAAANGISGQTLEVRIRQHGWSKQRALTEPVNRRHYKHPAYDQFKDQAEQNGIPPRVFGVRLGNGWAPERAATYPYRPRSLGNERIVEYGRARSKYPAELIERAAANGISRTTFICRVRDSGWDPEVAATRPLMTRAEISLLGKERCVAIHGNRDALIFQSNKKARKDYSPSER
ncbi:hypothetical protein M3223_08700 [Paenibacillus pasadenensis]|uniref:hypothetical protein n=1 Tax=Paenibacillus pasadenensis TaxID=217090 RepID=UPI002042214A|nr:hypothetical protein [Paenibacillus pasadenensis]MCM3747432.1 hypothetical protein [Paenibacillus pasadenensis]